MTEFAFFAYHSDTAGNSLMQYDPDELKDMYWQTLTSHGKLLDRITLSKEVRMKHLLRLWHKVMAIVYVLRCMEEWDERNGMPLYEADTTEGKMYCYDCHEWVEVSYMEKAGYCTRCDAVIV